MNEWSKNIDSSKYSFINQSHQNYTETKKILEPDLEFKLGKLGDKLLGLRKCKKELIDTFAKLKSLECDKYGNTLQEYWNLIKNERDLNCKLANVSFIMVYTFRPNTLRWKSKTTEG